MSRFLRYGTLFAFTATASVIAGLGGGCGDGSRSASAPATSTLPAQRLGDYFAEEFPIEYLYVPQGATGSSAPSAEQEPATFRRMLFPPGTEGHAALITAVSMTRLERKGLEGSIWAPAACAPSVWGFDHVPERPSPYFCILRQQRDEQPLVRIAIGGLGTILIETPKSGTLRFRADMPVFEWLAIVQACDSRD